MRPPRLCFEIVSRNHPHKDYAEIQDRYAAMGAQELVVFDPLLAGPATHGGPVSLQIWRRTEDGAFDRVAFGNDPAYCQTLDAWLVPDGRHLRIKDEPDAADFWPTGEESERAARSREHARAEREHRRAEQERQRAERERADKEAALQRIAELEAAQGGRR